MPRYMYSKLGEKRTRETLIGNDENCICFGVDDSK